MGGAQRRPSLHYRVHIGFHLPSLPVSNWSYALLKLRVILFNNWSMLLVNKRTS
jgi:hypothetical protein